MTKFEANRVVDHDEQFSFSHHFEKVEQISINLFLLIPLYTKLENRVENLMFDPLK